MPQLPPLAALLGVLPTDAVRNAISQCWSDLLAALCDTFRLDGAATLGSQDKDFAYQPGGVIRLGRWMTEAHRSERYPIVKFVGDGERQRRFWFMSQVLQPAGASQADADRLAPELLRHAFAALLTAAPNLSWLQREQQEVEGGTAEGLRIFVPELALRRPEALFRCCRTGHVWPRSVLGLAPHRGCDDLRPVCSVELDADPRVGRLRTEFRSGADGIFDQALWAEEHTAQLSPGENRRLQELFKQGARNILSSTTTLELGIDIGGLCAVLLGNAPPGLANYLQRAGQAGRRADGSAAVVTFCHARPFDHEVFRRFGDYLGSDLRVPRVLLDRERIAQRHANALLLGEFFREITPAGSAAGAMTAYGRMGPFCGVFVPAYWESKTVGKPQPQPSSKPHSLPAVP